MKPFVSLLFTALVLLSAPGPAAAATLREEEVLDLIAAEAALRFQVPRKDVVVEWQDNRLSSLVVNVPDGTVTLEVPGTARLSGRTHVPVQILVDGRKFRTIFPRVDVKVFQPVLIARRNLSRGELVSNEDVTLLRQAVSNGSGEPMRSLGALVGAQVMRDVPAGTALTAAMLKLPSLVKLGRVVTVELTVGDLTVLTTGEARSDGAMGQTVKVLNLASRREYTARVSGPDRVEIKMEELP